MATRGANSSKVTKAPQRSVARTMNPTERIPDAEVSTSVLLPLPAVALRLIEQAEHCGLIYIEADERRAEEIGRILTRLAPSLEVLVFPAWDCLPFDRASPSRDSMGRRMAVLQRLAVPADRPRIVLTTIDAALQRTPPLDRVAPVRFTVDEGADIDVAALLSFAERAGYATAERVDEPGRLDFHGQVAEVFPPDVPEPYRIEIADGRVAAIHSFDPVSQRSTGRVSGVSIGPASEIVPNPDEPAPEQGVGCEHHLPDHYQTSLPSLFDHLPEAILFLAPASEERRHAFLEQLEEAYAAHRSIGKSRAQPQAWQCLYIDDAAWQTVLEGHEERDIVDMHFSPVPVFTDAAKPVHAFQIFTESAGKEGRRVVLAGVPRDLAAFSRHLKEHGGRPPEPAADWAAIVSSLPGSFFSLDLDLEEGIVDEANGVTIVAAADVLGTRAHHAAAAQSGALMHLARPALKIGDTVIHEDHGVGLLRGLEAVEIRGQSRDAVRLEYHEGASVLVPIEDLDRVWRYGSEEDAVSLDRLHTEAWAKRRVEVDRAVVETARHLVAMADERRSRKAAKLVPAAKPYARFVARFAYPLTADQSRAVAAVTEDLASERPMDRLVCGDVGFGKTEVALRAAAVALLSGKQVALVAPTTVLARQHLQTFRKRFAGFGFEIAGLSRLEAGTEARRVKEGLAEGSIDMVIGTHAVAGAGVTFKDLGLLVIDEEQKFGAKLKATLRAMADAGHVLTMTATPIPRTLQLAMVGVQTVSVIATPPVRRRPIRTFVSEFDAAAARIALRREQARGGQSFVIVPRIEDIETMREQLNGIVPDLDVLVAHGEMSAEDADKAMVDFASGQGDVLLATNIVESGLDVPRANTILVWDAGRFGMTQLHQLRGRVGRGRTPGVAYLLTPPGTPTSDGARARLATLQGQDRLGAGFAISARDLDLRGAGDLVGEEQAGHLRLIGLELYQKLLGRAVREAKGEILDDVTPELHLERAGHIPESYVIEPDLRIELYSRLSRLTSGKALRAFSAEIGDRFGNPPHEVDTLFDLARLRLACRRLRAGSLGVGPRAVAITFHPKALEVCQSLAAMHPGLELKGCKLLWTDAAPAADPLARASALVDLLEEAKPAAPA